MQRTWACPSSCAVSQEVSTGVLLIQSLDIATHTKEKKQNYIENAVNNNTALMAAPIQFDQSLPDSLSGNDTTMPTVSLTHMLDLKLIGVSGDAIAEEESE